MKYKIFVLVKGVKQDQRDIISDIKGADIGCYKFCYTDKSLSQGVNSAADSRTLNLLTLHCKVSTGCNALYKMNGTAVTHNEQIVPLCPVSNDCQQNTKPSPSPNDPLFTEHMYLYTADK